VCREERDQCWEVVNIQATCAQQTVLRPFILQKKCPWLIVYSFQEHHFTPRISSIEAVGSGAGAQGVSIDNRRQALSIGGILFIPVCITKDATVGQWSIRMKTNVASSWIEETILAYFQVR
jgi:hypothetical protein